MNVAWSEQSISDLKAIRAYIATDSAFYADRMVERLILRVEHLARQPMVGHPVHEFPDAGLKEVHEDPYRIIYRPSTTCLEIVTILHFRRVLGKRRLKTKYGEAP